MTEITPAVPDPRSKLERAELSEETELEIFNQENPFSLYSKLPDNMRDRLMEMSKDVVKIDGKEFSWLELDTEEIKQKVRPSSTLNKLRIAFWVEYDISCRLKKTMNTGRIFGGICAREHFSRLIAKPKNMAWLIQPISSYQASLEDALLDSVSMLKKILSAPIYKKDGQLDTAAANVMIKIHKELTDRMHGTVVQKMEMKQLSIKKDLDKGSGVPHDIDAELAKLQSQVNSNNNILESKNDIEVEAKTIELIRADFED